MNALVTGLAAAIILVGIADVVTTRAAMARGAYEFNPIIRALMRVSNKWMMWKTVIHVGVAFVYVLAATQIWGVSSIAAAVFVVIIAIVSLMNHGVNRT